MSNTEDFNIWEGIYNSFDEAPVTGGGFESERWIHRSLEKIKETIKIEKENRNVEYVDLPLFSIAADTYFNNGSVKILDFGGGMGNSFVPLCSVLPDDKYVDFTVVEGEKSVAAAKKVFLHDNRIKFLTELPKGNNYDIIHISSSLQYIENWQSLLKNLSNYQAKYFIFTDLPTGNIRKTYISTQNYYESKIAHIFFKLGNIIDVMSNHSYDLIYQNNFLASILQVNKHYPQDNFKEEYRINYSKNLVFKKEGF